METNNNDKMLKDFFSEGKKEIADNGFTQRVMRNLPEQPDKNWIVGVFAVIGMLLTMAFGFYTGSLQLLLAYFHQIPIYYFLAAIFCFPLIGLISLYALQNKNRWAV
jgi:hypothetical protein